MFALACFGMFPALAGCIGPEFHHAPPIIAITAVHHWFEGDLLIVNVTVTNQSNFTPVEPDLSATLTEYGAWPDKSKYFGEDLDGKKFVFTTTALHFTMAAEYPWRNRYYEDKAAAHAQAPHSSREWGPVRFPPGTNYTIQFAFWPNPQYSGNQGYYELWLSTDADYPPSSPFHTQSGGDDYWTGCFNQNVIEFYGISDNLPDCNIYGPHDHDTSMRVVIDRNLRGLPYTRSYGNETRRPL
jgi:hypothetical protein